MSTLGGARIIAAELHIPPSGGCWGTVKLEQGAAPTPGLSTLVLRDLSLPVTVLRPGLDAPASPSAVVMGGAGWRALLPAPGASWTSPTAVRLSTVLAALAAISGEPYDAPAGNVTLGPSYGWDAATPMQPVRCRAILADLVARGAVPMWRVDPTSGHTRFDLWPTLPPADGAVQIIGDRDMTRGIRRCSVQGALAALLPGATLEGTTIARVVITETSDALEVVTWES